MDIVKRNISDLKPADYNPRVITEKELDNLKKSIHKCGYLELIVYNKRTDRIISGHQRLKALKELDVKEVEVIEVDLDEKDEKALNIAMNKISGDWDFPKLEVLLSDLKLEGLLDLTGFSELELKDLDKLVKKLENDNLEAEEDDFDESQVSENKYNVKRGDIYLLGKHKIMCGDSTNKEDVDKLMNGNKFRLCFTSPPYNMNAGMYKNYEDNYKSEEYINFNLNVINNIKRYLEGYIFWNISYNKNSRWEFLDIANKIRKECKLNFLELIVWNKKVAMPITSNQMLTRQYEDIFVYSDENYTDYELLYLGTNLKKVVFDKQVKKGITNYWEIVVGKTQLEEHKACFPVKLPGRAISLVTEQNSNVFDPFLGSGSTLIACEQLNRICSGMELDEHYCSVIIERYIKLKGNQEVFKLNEDGSKTHIGDL